MGSSHALGSECDFSHDSTTPTKLDSTVSTRLNSELQNYRRTSRIVPELPAIQVVSVVDRTATVDVADGGYYTLLHGSDFRYAQVWQHVYDETHRTNGTCVRMLMKIRSEGKTFEQHCWSSVGPDCGT
jgi:hypothetical protein